MLGTWDSGLCMSTATVCLCFCPIGDPFSLGRKDLIHEGSRLMELLFLIVCYLALTSRVRVTVLNPLLSSSPPEEFVLLLLYFSINFSTF